MFKKISLINYFAGTTCTLLSTDDPLCLLAVPREAIITHVKAEICGIVGDTRDVLTENRCIQIDYCMDLEHRCVITTLSQVPVGKRRYRNKLAMYYVTDNRKIVCVLEQVGPVHPGTCTLESGTTAMCIRE